MAITRIVVFDRAQLTFVLHPLDATGVGNPQIMKRFQQRLKFVPAGRRRFPLLMVILCIDDDHTALSVRRLLLSVAGYAVLTASSVEAALRLFNRNRVDLVVTDHWLPDGTGAELTCRTKQVKPNVPVVLLTGLVDIPPGYDKADLVLTKGVAPQEFLAAIETLVSADRNVS